jgi:hypothetical protein
VVAVATRDSWTRLTEAQDELEQARKDLMQAVAAYIQDPTLSRYDMICEACGRYAYWCAEVDRLRSEVERESRQDPEARSLPF